MSGHSKWHSIKHKKAKEDAKRGQIFGKLSRMITVAAREGGSGDPKDNIALANALAKAKEYNMPQDNIDRAIKRGTGELEGVDYESAVYEGYGPGGIAILVEVMTENKNRTASDIRNIFNNNNGSLGESGSVGWQFERKGILIIEKNNIEDEEEFMLNVIDAGAEDIDEEDQKYVVKADPTDFMNVKNYTEKKKIKIESSGVEMIPKSTLELPRQEAVKALKLINKLDDHDDVQNVTSNLDIPDELLSEIES
ncbi:MAG: YebC/PmpR family DNA-binding transcriptional regulator [Actinomycetota bacterium]